MTVARNLLLTTISFAMLLSAPAALAQPASRPDAWDHEQYFVAYLNGKRAGYMAERLRNLPDGNIETFYGMRLSIGAGAQTVKMVITRNTIESAAGRPISFAEYQLMGLTPLRRQGRIDGDKLALTSTQNGQTLTRTQSWDKSAFFQGAISRLLLEKLKTDGDECVYTAYDADQKGDGFYKVTVRRVGMEETTVLGEKVRLLHLVGTSPAFPSPMHSWVDEQFRDRVVVIELGPMLKIRADACTKEYAHQQFATTDVFAATLAHLDKPLPRNEKIISLRLTLTFKEPLAEPLDLPQTDRQRTIESTKDRLVLELRRPDYPVATQPDKLDDDLRAYLEPTEQFNTNDPEILKAADESSGKIADSLAKAIAIRDWVDNRLVFKTMGVGGGSASEAIRTRKGDCTEHAALLVAVARAAGIPARGVGGVVYAPSFGRDRDVLGGHAWAQLYVRGQWVDFDAALPGQPATACRIAAVLGSADGRNDPASSANLLKLIGNVKTASASNVVYQPATTQSEPHP